MSTTISPDAPAEVKEGKKERKQRERKPLLPLPEGTKLESVPEGFNPDTHRIARSQFKDVACYKEYQAFLCDCKAAAYRKEAEEWRLNPSKGSRKAALVARLAKLEEKLKELGVNVDDLFGDE